MKSKGNMYEFVETWNPLGGECPHGCTYCSSNSLRRFPVFKAKYSGKPRLSHEISNEFGGESKTIFVVGQNDLFAEKIESLYIDSVLLVCNIYNQHTWFFQTKNPIGFFCHIYPRHTILCTTIETNRWYWQMGNTPKTQDRAIAMSKIKNYTKQVTIEPIMDFDLPEMIELIKLCDVSQVNMGCDSKHNHLPEPSKEKVLELICELEKFTIIHHKTNLSRILDK